MGKRIDEGGVGAIIASAIYGVLTFLVMLLWAQTGHCADKPKVKLTASPMVALAGPTQPASIRLRLTIENGGEALYCPKIVWEWPWGTKSTEESDCLPYHPKMANERQSWGRLISVGPGEHTFIVKIEKAGKTLRTESVNVTVH